MWRMRVRPSLGAAVGVAAFVLVLTACGGGSKGSAGSSAASSEGAKVFASSGCGSCHTLAEAKTKGTVGPNLDALKPEAERVARQVRNGGPGMPSFSQKLSPLKIQQVADFVSRS